GPIPPALVVPVALRPLWEPEVPVARRRIGVLEQLPLDRNGVSGGIQQELGEVKALQVLFFWGNVLSVSDAIPP
ncbi:unnamed protein product, partial [Urochloa humidicola]